jgi:Neocarzinostatin family
VSLRSLASFILGSVAIIAVVASAVAENTQSPPPRQIVASKPVVRVVPRTGLAGGEPVRVSLRGFPAHVEVGLSECPRARTVGRAGCSGAHVDIVTDAAGSASGTFVVRPSAVTAGTTLRMECRTNCVLAAVEVPKFVRPLPAATARATASLGFKPGAPAGRPALSFVAVSWVDAHDGWALTQRPCAEGACAAVARTFDGGANWIELPATAALVPPAGHCTSEQCASGVSGVAFANLAVGYLYGPALFMSSNGGESWQPVSGPKVAALAVGDGRAFRVAYTHSGCPGPCTPSLQSAPVGSSRWQTVLEPKAMGAARFQILVSGEDVYLVMYGDIAAGAGTQQAILFRSVDAGATFARLTDPCAGTPGGLGAPHVLTALAAAPDGILEGVCTPRAGSGVRSLITSIDAGSAWDPPRTLPPGTFGVIAAASASTIAVSTGPRGGSGTITSALLITTDGGATWRSAATETFQLGTPGVAWLGFPTARFGWWIPDSHSVFASADGGVRWTRRYPGPAGT